MSPAEQVLRDMLRNADVIFTDGWRNNMRMVIRAALDIKPEEDDIKTFECKVCKGEMILRDQVRDTGECRYCWQPRGNDTAVLHTSAYCECIHCNGFGAVGHPCVGCGKRSDR